LAEEYIALLLEENSKEAIETPGSGTYEMIKLLKSDESDDSLGA